MDFIDTIKQFAKRLEGMKDNIQTEEATKTSMIMPFFQQILGYDVFNPEEFIPEYTADFGTKKGERVDYAIVIDGQLSILVEAKPCDEQLDKHGAQLFRYFNTTTARFGILTNGIIYRFFTDLEKDNIMDDTPFFEFNFFDFNENDVVELKKFCKSNFDVEDIASTASQLKYIGLMKNLFDEITNSPDDHFVRYVMSEVYDGVKNQNAIDRFRPLVKTAFKEYVNELMSEKIALALKGTDVDIEVVETPETETETAEPAKDDGIITTESEMEAFYTVRTILNEVMPREDVTYKDTKAYFGILYRDNTWKWICRFKFQRNNIIFILPDENKKEIKYSLNSLDDINDYKTELRETAKRYISDK